MTEQQLQAQCFIWHWNTYPKERRMLFHADNNSFNQIIGNRKKSQGVVSGVADLILILWGSRSLYIEMKTETGRQSQTQIEFMQKVQERGHQYVLVRTFEDFKILITTIYGN